MTKLQRRNKSRWCNRLKKRGYTYRHGKVWERWRWTIVAGLTKSSLPIYHSDHEEAR